MDEALAAPIEEAADDLHGVLIFRLAQEWLALSVQTLVEVTTLRPVHRIPHRAGVVAGLVNIRGELHLSMHLDRVLGIQPPAQEEAKDLSSFAIPAPGAACWWCAARRSGGSFASMRSIRCIASPWPRATRAAGHGGPVGGAPDARRVPLARADHRAGGRRAIVSGAANEDAMSDSGEVSLLDLFREEVRSHTATLGEGLLDLEGEAANPRKIEPLMRAAHSIKGAARIVGIDAAVGLAHVMEDAFVAAQTGKIRITAIDVDVLLKGTDLLAELSQATEADVQEWGRRRQAGGRRAISQGGQPNRGEASPPAACRPPPNRLFRRRPERGTRPTSRPPGSQSVLHPAAGRADRPGRGASAVRHVPRGISDARDRVTCRRPGDLSASGG